MPSSRAAEDPDPELELDYAAELSDEARDVLRWRLDVLERAGYPAREAWTLARSRADLHDACRMLRAGCAPELAVRILT